MRTRVKICGVTRAQDAWAAARCGADAVGAVFIEGSARALELSAVRSVFSVLPPFVTRVGLFRNADPAFVREVAALGNLTSLQFHGEETDAQCAAFGLPFVKVIDGNNRSLVAGMCERYPSATGFCLDSVSKGEGGTGKVFDWAVWPAACDKPLILAGGLHAGNVADAIVRLKPWGVDVSTGVEDGVKGQKSHEKIHSFLGSAHRADLVG